MGEKGAEVAPIPAPPTAEDIANLLRRMSADGMAVLHASPRRVGDGRSACRYLPRLLSWRSRSGGNSPSATGKTIHPIRQLAKPCDFDIE